MVCFTMKKIILEITKNLPQVIMEVVGFKSIFKYIERLEVLHIYRYDNNNLIALQKYRFRTANYRPKDLLEIKDLGLEYIEVLTRKGNEYIVFVKTHKNNEFHRLVSDFDIILQTPLIFSEDYIKLSVISHEDQLKRVLNFFYNYASKDNMKVLSIMPIKYDINSVQSILTDKQWTIMNYAVKNGYYEIPREISSEQLSEEFGISVSAVHEHIRKSLLKILNIVFNE
ncbi:MAG: hypothetical protein GF329_15980 [Candidatus Lokiarchaeota archaeon]|nr:hypothetical protein [Candidatus Lokiarchaeota archaeon]